MERKSNWINVHNNISAFLYKYEVVVMTLLLSPPDSLRQVDCENISLEVFTFRPFLKKNQALWQPVRQVQPVLMESNMETWLEQVSQLQ